jgi:hypothetical protein
MLVSSFLIEGGVNEGNEGVQKTSV